MSVASPYSNVTSDFPHLMHISYLVDCFSHSSSDCLRAFVVIHAYWYGSMNYWYGFAYRLCICALRCILTYYLMPPICYWYSFSCTSYSYMPSNVISYMASYPMCYCHSFFSCFYSSFLISSLYLLVRPYICCYPCR